MKIPVIPPCRTGRSLIGIVLCTLLVLIASGLSQAPWGTPLTPPGVAAASCAAPSKDATGALIPPVSSFTFGLMDLRGPSLTDYSGCTPTAPLWNAPMYHHATWNAKDLGNVFGITHDARGDIYVAAHGLYGAFRPFHHRYGDIGGGASSLSAAGTVYKIDRLSGAVSVFAVIPGQQAMSLSGGLTSGPGLGNLSYDATHQQFFVTSLEDGKIYRVNSSGVIAQVFDPMTPDSGAAGMPVRSERLWAIEVLRDAVYYSVWNQGTPSDPVKIRRVDILPSGALDPGSDTEVLTVPGKPTSFHAIPVSDITFSSDGTTMVLGERTMLSAIYSYNHGSGTHLAKLSGTTWSVTHTMATGCNAINGEGYGGVTYGDFNGNPEGTIWTSSADMRTAVGPHGLFGVRAADFPLTGKATRSWKVPYDPAYTNHYWNDVKGSGGDVETRRIAGCAKIEVGRIECPERPDLPYTATLTITNQSPHAIAYAVFTPCPLNELPASATTGQPRPRGVITLPHPINPGESTSLTINIPATATGVFCFQITFLSEDGEECCTEKICVRLPECECAQVIDRKIDCELQADGTVKYTIGLTIKNLTSASGAPFPFGYATILPPAGFSPSLLSPSPNPIPPGGIGTIETCYFGAPGPLCLQLAFHDPQFTTCCPIEVCLNLPECGDVKPDTCAIRDRFACCPPDGVTPVTFTICNNSPVARTYTWTAAGIASAACTRTLSPSNFSPASGTLGPIPPGGCLTGKLEVHCEDFDPGDCARLQICFSHNSLVPPMCCTTEVYRPKPGEPIVKIADVDDGIAVGGTLPVRVTLTNPGSSLLRVPVLLLSEDGALELRASRTPEAVPSAIESSQIVSIPPNASEEIVTNVTLPRDPGAPFANLVVVVGARGLDDIADAFAPTVVPIPITGPQLAIAAFRVDAIHVQHPSEGQPHVVMQVPTIEGHRYRIERSESMNGLWDVSACTVEEVLTGPDGIFTGNGEILTCRVPCAEGENAMFFRIRDLSFD